MEVYSEGVIGFQGYVKKLTQGVSCVSGVMMPCDIISFNWDSISCLASIATMYF